ncbi:MAG: tetratricopeptide repeat protein [Terriglobia bacterium]
MLAQILVRQNQPSEAKKHFQKAVLANSRYKEAWFGLGKAELMLGHPASAIDPLKRAIAIDSKYAQAHFLLGDALARLGRSSEARKEHELSAQIQAQQQAQYTRKLDTSHSPSSPRVQ